MKAKKPTLDKQRHDGRKRHDGHESLHAYEHMSYKVPFANQHLCQSLASVVTWPSPRTLELINKDDKGCEKGNGYVCETGIVSQNKLSAARAPAVRNNDVTPERDKCPETPA